MTEIDQAFVLNAFRAVQFEGDVLDPVGPDIGLRAGPDARVAVLRAPELIEVPENLLNPHLPPETLQVELAQDQPSPVANAHPLLDIGMAKFFAPELGQQLAFVRPWTQPGSERATMTAPIAPSNDVSDLMLFEAPADPSKRFYLPRYRVATHLTDKGEQFRISLERQDPGTRLTIVLEPFPAPEITAADPAAKPLDHSIAVLLTYEVPGGGGLQREIPFTEQTISAAGISVSGMVPTLPERGELFSALTLPEAKTALIVRRLVDVSVPVGFRQTDPGPGPRPDPGEVAVAVEPVFIVEDRRFTGLLTATELTVVDPQIARPRIAHPPAARRDFAELQPVADLQISDLRARPALDREAFVAADRSRIRIPLGPFPFPVPIPPQPGQSVTVLYAKASRTLDTRPAPVPFTFPPGLHPYIFGGISAGGGEGGMILEQIVFNGVHHSYYRQAGRPDVAYFLPDSFKLARVPERPRVPFFSVAFETPDGTLESTRAVVQLVASPVVDPARLVAAAAGLRARLAQPGDGPSRLDLQPFLADSARLVLRMSLPGQVGGAQEMPGAVIDLRAGLRTGFTVPLAQFQALFDAIQAGGNNLLLTGEVEVALDRPDRPAEKVPFTVRMDDLVGQIVELVTTPDPATNGFTVTITNIIESPIRLDALPAEVRLSTGRHPATVTGLPAAPAVLKPGKSLTVSAAPAQEVAETPMEVFLDLSRLVVLPDREAIWEAMSDSATSQLERTIQVKTPAVMFEQPAAGTAVIELVVDIRSSEGGLPTTVALNATALQHDVDVSVPYGDVILRREDAGAYRYKVTTVRTDRATEGEEKKKTSAVLWILTGDVT